MQFVRNLGQSARSGLALVGSLTIASQYVNFASEQKRKKQASKDRFVQLDMSMNITEAPPKPFDVITQAQRPPMSLRQVCDAIRWASVDPNVKGIVCTFSGESANSWATIQEVRDAILEFRAAQSSLPQDERRIACVAGDSFGEGGSQGTGQYYLASAFDKIYLQPSGLVGMIGLHAESYFLKDMLAKIGIKPQFFKYYEYKNAANMFTEDSFTKEHKEQSVKLFESLFRQLIEGVAKARGLDQSAVRKMVDESPLTAEEAVKHGLVDGVQYTDQVYSKIGVGKDCPLQDLAKYWKEGDKAEKNVKGAAAGEEKKSIFEEGTRAITEIMDKAKAKKDEEVIALVTACGTVKRGRAGQQDMGATGVVNAIRAAVKDDKVKGIVVRVDTRGGSAVASDTIRRELEWARESGKPVVVSMGSYAASGGYYIATGADKIVAQPGTITGSIGVVLGKFTIGEVLEKLGVAVGDVDLGKRAESLSSTKPWNKEIAERAESLGEIFYKDFVGHVSKARGMTYQQVDALARGRVWTGEQALALGLVDSLGGLRKAHESAASLVKTPLKRALPPLVDYPKKKKPIEEVIELLGGKTDPSKDMSLTSLLGLGDVFEAAKVLSDTVSAIRAVRESSSGVVECRHED